MARITTEDCEHLVDGRFELVAVAAERTKQILSGAPTVVEAKNDKATVTSLRELKYLNIDELRHALVARMQKHATEDHSHDQDTTLADDLIAEDAGIGFISESDDMGMFSEEDFDPAQSNLYADEGIEDDEDK